MNEPETIQDILELKTIAVVGLSAKPVRPSYRVAAYMQSQGYRIIPVNPGQKEILGEKCYRSLKDIPDSVAQAKAAAARVLATINVGTVQMEANTTVINENVCCGCQTCINVCPYTAISFDSDKKVSVVNEAICKGCGTCGSTCPTGATHIKHFTDEQILSQIEGLMQLEPA